MGLVSFHVHVVLAQGNVRGWNVSGKCPTPRSTLNWPQSHVVALNWMITVYRTVDRALRRRVSFIYFIASNFSELGNSVKTDVFFPKNFTHEQKNSKKWVHDNENVSLYEHSVRWIRSVDLLADLLRYNWGLTKNALRCMINEHWDFSESEVSAEESENATAFLFRPHSPHPNWSYTASRLPRLAANSRPSAVRSPFCQCLLFLILVLDIICRQQLNAVVRLSVTQRACRHDSCAANKSIAGALPPRTCTVVHCTVVFLYKALRLSTYRRCS